MKRKGLWMLISCLILVLLVLGCAPAATQPIPTPAPVPSPSPTPTPAPTQTPAPGKEMVKDSLGKLVEKPQYGGEFILATEALSYAFDQAYRAQAYTYGMKLTNQELMRGDWAKGPTGSGEATFYYGAPSFERIRTGIILEKWELTASNPTVLILHIRKGIHYSLNPKSDASRLANGRELTATDVIYSINRMWSLPTSYMYTRNPNAIISATATDKYTVELKLKQEQIGAWEEIYDGFATDIAKEVIDKYGDMRDWRVSVGTGPFMIVDYIESSSATYARNPNFWMKDPLHPENQLPYIDQLKWLIIPDKSARLAALRTGKVDWSGLGVNDRYDSEDASGVLNYNKNLKYNQWPPYNGNAVFFKPDVKPFDDIRVRRALSMAIDREALKNLLYKGKATIFYYPVAPVADLKDYFVPLDKMSQEAQDVYKYNPEKAKQLLADAGYPNGFNAEIVCQSVNVDELSIVKEYWSKIGVNLSLDVKDVGVFTSLGNGKSFKQLYFVYASSHQPTAIVNVRPGHQYNYGTVNDPTITSIIAAVDASIFDEKKQAEVYKTSYADYVTKQVYLIPLPSPDRFNFWQPWVKSYSGENQVGKTNYYDFAMYIWLDQGLKQQITGSR